MTFQQIRYFLILAEELHFWRTAERVYLSQSSLSRQIQSLEDELGFKLFERDKRNVRLTPAGVFLKQQWTVLLDEFDRSRTQAQKIDAGSAGRIAITYPGSIAFRFLPELLRSLHQRMPDLKIELTEPTDESQAKLLLDLEVDMVLSRDQLDHPRIASQLLYTEPICLVVPADHPLQAAHFKDLSQLREENFILSGLHHPTHFASMLRQLFHKHGFEPKMVVESDYGGMILHLVSQKLGISLLPSSFRYAPTSNIRFMDLDEEVGLFVNYRRNDPNKVVARSVAEAMALGKDFQKTSRPQE